MIELVAVARVFTGRIRALHRTRFVVVAEDDELVNLVRATIIANRISRKATKEGTDLVHEFLGDLVELFTVEVVVVSWGRRVFASNVDHLVGIANDTNTGDTVLALEHKGVIQERGVFFGHVLVTPRKSTHQRTNGPDRSSRCSVELQTVDLVLGFRSAVDPFPLFAPQRRRKQTTIVP